MSVSLRVGEPGDAEPGRPPPNAAPSRRWDWRYHARIRLSRFRALILTALGKPRGFFTQYPYVEHMEVEVGPYPEVESLCAKAPYGRVLEEIRRHRDIISSFGHATNDPMLNRGMFPALDGMAAYACVRMFKPKRIIEIGSGDSTYFLARGVKDNGFGHVTCIDPQPRREIIDLDVDFKPRLMRAADAVLADELEAGDILFIDSSHIMLPGMDVDIQFNRLFPRLKPGVLVHVHDIFLPDGYPIEWHARNYSEQNALVGWLFGSSFEIIWPGQYVFTRHRALVDSTLEGLAAPSESGSFWIRKLIQ
jgi:hypothetical protein